MSKNKFTAFPLAFQRGLKRTQLPPWVRSLLTFIDVSRGHPFQRSPTGRSLWKGFGYPRNQFRKLRLSKSRTFVWRFGVAGDVYTSHLTQCIPTLCQGRGGSLWTLVGKPKGVTDPSKEGENTKQKTRTREDTGHILETGHSGPLRPCYGPLLVLCKY